MELPILVGGSVIIEDIFNLPGLGRLMLDALKEVMRRYIAEVIGERNGLLVEYRAFGDGLDGRRSVDHSGAFSDWTYP